MVQVAIDEFTRDPTEDWLDFHLILHRFAARSIIGPMEPKHHITTGMMCRDLFSNSLVSWCSVFQKLLICYYLINIFVRHTESVH